MAKSMKTTGAKSSPSVVVAAWNVSESPSVSDGESTSSTRVGAGGDDDLVRRPPT